MRSNKTPFTDIVELINASKTVDVDGYETETLTYKQVYCSVIDGVTRSEFYEAYKAGLRVDITVELHEADYEKNKQLKYNDIVFDIVRAYPTGYGTLELTCKEAIR